MSTVHILNLNFVNNNFDGFLNDLETLINHHINTFVATVNPEIAVYSVHHPKFQDIITKADYITPDGIGIIKASKKLGHPIPHRITGYDIFKALLKWANVHHKKVYCLGSKPFVIQKLKKTVNENYPHLRLLCHDGYFKNIQPITNQIKHWQPDIIFLGLGSPKQEELINKYRPISNSLWIGVGGSFDALTGVVKRAPKFWINHHLEWLYRALKQPTRFKRLLALPQFVYLVHKQIRQH